MRPITENRIGLFLRQSYNRNSDLRKTKLVPKMDPCLVKQKMLSRSILNSRVSPTFYGNEIQSLDLLTLTSFDPRDTNQGVDILNHKHKHTRHTHS